MTTQEHRRSMVTKPPMAPTTARRSSEVLLRRSSIAEEPKDKPSGRGSNSSPKPNTVTAKAAEVTQALVHVQVHTSRRKSVQDVNIPRIHKRDSIQGFGSMPCMMDKYKMEKLGSDSLQRRGSEGNATSPGKSNSWASPPSSPSAGGSPFSWAASGDVPRKLSAANLSRLPSEQGPEGVRRLSLADIPDVPEIDSDDEVLTSFTFGDAMAAQSLRSSRFQAVNSRWSSGPTTPPANVPDMGDSFLDMTTALKQSREKGIRQPTAKPAFAL